MDTGEKQIGLGVLLRDTWKQYGFWQDLNSGPSCYESSILFLAITLMIPVLLK
jgi:hypothetical protein